MIDLAYHFCEADDLTTDKMNKSRNDSNHRNNSNMLNLI